MGHTMSIHSEDDDVILEFGLKKPAYRIVVNTPTTHGSIGLTTGLDPSMTLGCGGYGGNITSDNISPRHLLNIKRLAYETQPAIGSRASKGRETASAGASVATQPTATRAVQPVDFVSEADVRAAMAAGRKIVIGERTIVTPSARDLANEHDVLISMTGPQS
jgi:acetaldehyde dehydrogenase (acetylating)